MTPMERTQQSALKTGLRYLRSYASFRNQVDRLGRQADTVVGDLLFALTTDHEKSQLTQACYESTSHLRGTGLHNLFEWERQWFEKDLPKPPARILLGGAGWGREVVALESAGYTVVAFEPARANADENSKFERAKTPIINASYEELAATVLRHADTPLSEACKTHFDAIVFGWGSLTHVFSQAAREELLTAAHALAPGGPILGSLWCRDAPRRVDHNPWRMALNQCAHALARLRGIEPQDAQDFEFSTAYGFAVYVPSVELNAMAIKLNRDIDLKREPYGHFTMTVAGKAPTKKRRKSQKPRSKTPIDRSRKVREEPHL